MKNKLFILGILLCATYVYSADSIYERRIGVSNEAYNATTWDGVTGTAPSKNAVRDKIESLSAASFSVTDITGQTDDTTPATTATAVLAQGGSLIESTLGQIATAINPTAATLHIDDTLTALGIASEATNFGTFTGSTIADNQTAKVALQSLETAVETKAPASGIALTALANQAAQTVNANATDGAAAPTAVAISASQVVARLAAGNIKGASTAEMKTLLGYYTASSEFHLDDLLTAVGVAAEATSMGTFTGSTIADSQTAKAAMQALETAVELRPLAAAGTHTGLTTINALALSTAQALTLSSDAVSGVTSSKIIVTSESSTSDTLKEITCTGTCPSLLLVYPAAGHTITVTDTASSTISIPLGSGITLVSTGQPWALFFHDYLASKYVAVTLPDTINFSALDMTSATSVIPWKVGTDPDLTVDYAAGLDTDGANVTGDMTLRVRDTADNQVMMARKLHDIHVTVVKPQDMADAVRDAFLVWSNETGMTFTITGWKCWAGADDTSLNIETTAADGSTNATVDAVECATGSGPYTGSDTTITAGTIAAGSLIWLDFDDTDDPSYVKLTITGWFDANVD